MMITMINKSETTLISHPWFATITSDHQRSPPHRAVTNWGPSHEAPGLDLGPPGGQVLAGGENANVFFFRFGYAYIVYM